MITKCLTFSTRWRVSEARPFPCLLGLVMFFAGVAIDGLRCAEWMEKHLLCQTADQAHWAP